MFNLMLIKKVFMGPYKFLAMVPLVVFLAWLILRLMTDQDVLQTREPENNKLFNLGSGIYNYFWPKPMEEPSYNYIRRLWKKFN